MCRKFKVKSGEMVAPRFVVDDTELRNAIMDLLDEIGASQIEVTEQELAERINDLAEQFGSVDLCERMAQYIHRKFEKANETKPTRPRVCEQCGAPLHKGMCEYCGTEY